MAHHGWQEAAEAPSVSPGPSAPSLYSPYSLDPNYLPQGPEFIFPVEVRKKSWNEQMFDRTGSCYLLGLTAGGAWGLWEGIRRPEGRTTRLRVNSVLNSCTRRGPFLGNTAAVLALMYSPLCSALAHYRGVDDSINSIAAASITGLLYKSTAGLRAMGVAGAAGCVALGIYSISSYYFGGSQSLLFS
ncbi:PREDICTED: mitochondrial import inner membrane translocase subunit tim23-like [Amphimedon queenslandica]|uniref:Mitochondrial import inner membrane translocase subunit TIM23 n=1 Tax=Amphimedon queenslandica TaxID=400682 RepID=A0A1X7V5G6_AMPQE|nr:PREDICTED: mitochondrial import inner membrane translocase subunit tim23-like [Amphimedon queenslandica]|eukprot:XP_003385589.1 PREDICTED: mitochondrial import inner membrane translocase subunit tim23-like [Amphimedon queenslandica]